MQFKQFKPSGKNRAERLNGAQRLDGLNVLNR